VPSAGGSVSGPATIQDRTGTETVTITENVGYSLAGVTASNGSITSSAPYVLSNVTADTTVTATFAPQSHRITLLALSSAGGTVSGPETLLTGDTAILSVTPQPGYTLASVTASKGSITTSAPYVLSNVTADTTVRATFTAGIHAVGYAATPAGGGSVRGPETVTTGESVRLTVTANSGYETARVTATNGNVTASEPYMLSNVTAETTVTATFTRRQVPVPDLSGMDLEAAQAALDALGLTMSTEEEDSDTVPAGQILRQDPAAGTQTTPGGQVHLVLSSGPQNAPTGCAGSFGKKGAFAWEKLKQRLGGLVLF